MRKTKSTYFRIYPDTELKIKLICNLRHIRPSVLLDRLIAPVWEECEDLEADPSIAIVAKKIVEKNLSIMIKNELEDPKKTD